jgi:hypothetical protein
VEKTKFCCEYLDLCERKQQKGENYIMRNFIISISIIIKEIKSREAEEAQVTQGI